MKLIVSINKHAENNQIRHVSKTGEYKMNSAKVQILERFSIIES